MKAVKRKVWSPQAALPPPNPTPALLQPPADDEDLMILSDDENLQEGGAAMGGGATESQVHLHPHDFRHSFIRSPLHLISSSLRSHHSNIVRLPCLFIIHSQSPSELCETTCGEPNDKLCVPQDLGQGLGGPSWSLPPFIPESQQPSLNLRLESQTQVRYRCRAYVLICVQGEYPCEGCMNTFRAVEMAKASR